MIQFPSLAFTAALHEGLVAISTLVSSGDGKALKAIEKILSTHVDFSFDPASEEFVFLVETARTKALLVHNFDVKKAGFTDLLMLADTGSLDYKRFSFFIQLLLNYLNPKLNPSFYPNGTFEKGLTALLMSTGACDLPHYQKDWPFRLGETIATTEGYVIFENEFLQLLCYPAKNKVAKEIPVFIIPSWINKYYIFDLSKNNSYIHWLNSNDITVYCISWVNPDRTFFDRSFSDYICLGIHRAVEKALSHADVLSLNFVGYCIGGVALTVYAGWLAKQERELISSLTFLSTPFDFEKLDGLRLFISEDQIDSIEDDIINEGLLNGNKMQRIFALLRANDVLIQAVIDQVYLEKMPKPLDFLFWNADTTHVPGKLHLDYIRDVFLKNALLLKSKSIAGLQVDIDAITCPVFIVGTKKDHIVSWRSCFSAVHIFPHVTFCLGGSGHVAGIINPPAQEKYGYQTREIPTKNEDEWLSGATQHTGSWWTYWHAWVRPNLGKDCFKTEIILEEVIERAPGRYAFKQAASCVK
ncbi:MAG: alpha/beta fold hydrolase [Pseudomonadota bacterium]